MTADLPLEELSTTFARIQGLLLSEETVSKAVDLLADAAKESIPGTLGAGVSLMDEQGRRTSWGATDEIVKQADALQYQLGEGPCITAWATTGTVRTNDVTTEDRWSRWSPRAADLGLRSVLSAPLVFRTESVGAIKVYSDKPGAFDARSERLLTLFAGPAATLLANVQSSQAPRRLSQQLKDAIASRDNVAFARGILMEREGLGEDESMARLLEIARSNRVTLRTAAGSVVSGSGKHQG
jgi:GAF domain-containing protein